MPERIAFSHAFGGLATSLVGVAEHLKIKDMMATVPGYEPSRLELGALGFEVFFGALTFTGSIMAFGKLQGMITGAPVTWKGQNVMNIGAFFGAIALLVYQVAVPDAPSWMFYAMLGTGFSLGILAVLPIGGADMPCRHLSAQLVRRPRCVRDRVCARQQHPSSFLPLSTGRRASCSAS